MSFVGKDIPHDSAAGHVTGESIFLDDVTPARNEVFVDFVGSPVAHGELLSIDVDAARKIPGVVAIFTHEDVPGHNDVGPVVKDEHLLVEKEAVFVGDPIVLIAAESRESLARAKRAVKITMRELPPVFSIDDAIAQQQFLSDPASSNAETSSSRLPRRQMSSTERSRSADRNIFTSNPKSPSPTPASAER